MAWEIEYTDEFGEWWSNLTTDEQQDIAAGVLMLEQYGPALGRPHVDTLALMSRFSNMKELRVVHRGDAYRVLFAFDPRRIGILLLGGRKPDQKWYKKAVPAADKLYADHLETIRTEEKEAQ